MAGGDALLFASRVPRVISESASISVILIPIEPLIVAICRFFFIIVLHIVISFTVLIPVCDMFPPQRAAMSVCFSFVLLIRPL